MEQETSQFECEICGDTFRDRDALAKHLKVHEQGSEVKDLEQGTQPPTENPTMPPNIPGPIRAGQTA